MAYSRVLLKVSGEMLMGNRSLVHDPQIINQISLDIKEAHESGIEVCVVIGGGNIYRGSSGLKGIERATSDYMGMIATVINALALQGMLESCGISSRVLSAIPMATVCEPYIRRKAIRHAEKGRVVIFAGGTGNPFFTTDTAAVLRAIEMNCDAIFKGTSVDGVYSSDPKKNGDAVKISQLSYTRLLAEKLGVMDASAISLARESLIPILVFSLKEKGEFTKILSGKSRNYSIIEGD